MKQKALIDVDPEWRKHWQEMPEFSQEKQTPFANIQVRFETAQDLEAFAQLLRQNLTSKTKSIWFPYKSHWGKGSNKIWVDCD